MHDGKDVGCFFLQESLTRMGNGPSKEERAKMEKEELEAFRRRLEEAPDFRVNEDIRRFTSLYSSDHLRQHYQWRTSRTCDDPGDWSLDLKSLMKPLGEAPELVGLGALAIAVHIDLSSLCPPKESTREALRHVFAEEKVTATWDLIDECLKETIIYINHRDELVSSLKHLERQLSTAITRLRNAMVNDGHMSTESLKVWVNAAAFHVQMLIHLVRLGGLPGPDPVERLLNMYQRDLLTLSRQHQDLIRSRCRLKLLAPCDSDSSMPYLIDEESHHHQLDPSIQDHYSKYLRVYLDQRYGRQVQDIQEYFRELRDQLPSLLDQTATFPSNP